MEAPRYPNFEETLTALGRVGRVLDRDVAYLHGSTYHFPLFEEWRITLTPESAGRFRVDLAHGLDPRTSIWSSARDHARLEAAVAELAGHVVTLV